MTMFGSLRGLSFFLGGGQYVRYVGLSGIDMVERVAK